MATQQDLSKSEKKGELYELRQDLKSDRKDRKKDAIKRIISYMTIGKDVSELFTDVLNLIQTDNTEIKKLVYLYLMNYARSHPDLALLSVNTFVRDCEDPNPLIRALSVRTMGCIRVPDICEYLCEPLRRCLSDEDPYVRKTAALCVVKLYNLNPVLVQEQGFITKLNDLLRDSNPMVLSNAVAALLEITNRSKSGVNHLILNSRIVGTLLTAMSECTEWGQIYILDALIQYDPVSEDEARVICERLTSRLSHANSAVVLATVKVLLKCVSLLDTKHFLTIHILKKLGPPLVTMLNMEPEIVYVALRNIELIAQKYPELLRHEIKSFFIKYNDPIYIKLEKLEIIIKLADEENIEQILSELKEYSSEVEVDFVRRSVRMVGLCALKVEVAADKCVNTLLELIQSQVSYVVQETIIVARDIMRKFPNKYEGILEKIGEKLDVPDEPEAKGAVIWIIGEYADRIESSSEILKCFVNNFFDESSSVQLHILTAVVKLFLKCPNTSQDLVQDLLTMVTQQCDNPDIRDRGFVYWRLLSSDSLAAKDIVLALKPPVSHKADNLDQGLLDELLLNISSLASVYHKWPKTLLDGSVRLSRALKQQDMNEEDNSDSSINATTNFDAFSTVYNQVSSDSVKKTPSTEDILNLSFNQNPRLRLGSSKSSNDMLADVFANVSLGCPQTHVEFNHPPIPDFFSNILIAETQIYSQPFTNWINSTKGKGLEVNGCFNQRGSKVLAMLTMKNLSNTTFSDFIIQFNVNYFGLCVNDRVKFPTTLSPNEIVNVEVSLEYNDNSVPSDSIEVIQVALKNNIDVFYFTVNFPIHLFFKDASNFAIGECQFLSVWSAIPQSNHFEITLPSQQISKEKMCSKLNMLKISPVLLSNDPTIAGQCILKNNASALLKIIYQPTNSSYRLMLRSNNAQVLKPLSDLISVVIKLP